MKKLTGLFILILISSQALGQRVKYKDVFPLISNAPDEVARVYLNNYLLEDLHHPNANLRLAMIYKRGYQNADVLVDYKKAMAFAEKCKLQFIKSRTVVDKKDLSRNAEYYVPFATSFDRKGDPELTIEEIQAIIQTGYDSADLFTQKMPRIYENFTASVNNYGEAYELYHEISNTYKSLDDLLMLYDQSLKEKLLSIKSHMDTSLTRFEVYRELISDYSVNDYNQKIKLKPINYFRLDGLEEESNFLQPNIVLWDYSAWVDQIISLHDSEIIDLRKKMLRVNNNITASAKRLKSTNNVEDAIVLQLDKELVYKLNKYDHESLALGILEYNAFKQNLRLKEKQKTFYDTASTVESFSKYNFYSDLIKQQVIADSLLQNIHNRNNSYKLSKHNEFIEAVYGGPQGLEIFLKDEDEERTRDFNFYRLSLRNEIIDEWNGFNENETDWVEHKENRFALFLNETDNKSQEKREAVTTAIDYKADSSLYIGGYRYDGESLRTIAFIARLSPHKKVEWMKEFDIMIDSGVVDASSKITDIEVTKAGCAAVIRSRHIMQSLYVNSVIYVGDDGEQKINKRLEYGSFPRKILYDQTNSRFVFVLKGDTPAQQVTNDESTSIVAYNTLGDKLWERQVSFSGSFEDLLNLQNGYLMLGNYTKIKDHEGNLYNTKAQLGETYSFAMGLNTQGDIEKVAVYEKPEGYYISKVYKVNDGNINLFGVESKYSSDKPEISYHSDNLIHFMIDKDLEEIKLN